MQRLSQSFRAAYAHAPPSPRPLASALALAAARPKSTLATPPVSAPPPNVPEPLWASTVVHGRALAPAYQHPRTHNVPVALVHLRSYYPDLLAQFAHFLAHAAAALAIPVSRPAALPTQRSLWTVPRGPFVHKKSQENFERRVHKRAVKAWDADPDVVDRWVRYLEEHAMPGVGIRVVRWHRVPVAVGEAQVRAVKGQMRIDRSSADKVRLLGEKIVKQEMAAAASPPKEATAPEAESS